MTVELEQVREQWMQEVLPAYPMKIARPYQEDVFNQLEQHFQKKNKRALTHLATGAGKTFIAIEYIRRKILAKEVTSRKPVIWMVHRSELLWQAIQELYAIPKARRKELGLNHNAIAILGSSPNNYLSNGLLPEGENNKALIYFTTRQSFEGRYQYFSKSPSYIIWDECHEGDGASWQQGPTILNHFRRKRTKVLGLTATPKQQSFSFDETDVVCSKTLQELINLGYLAKPVTTSVSTGVDWTPEIGSIRGSDFQNTEELNTDYRNQLIVQEYVRNRARYGKTIVFAINIVHAECLIEAFKSANITATYVHSKMPKDKILAAIKDYREGRKEVIINISILTVGFDAPKTQTIFMCRPTNSETFYLQSIGRGTRIPEGSSKRHFNIVDFVDNLARHRDSLATAGRLFSSTGRYGDKPAYNPSREMRRRVEAGEHFFETGITPSFICEMDGLPSSMLDFWYYPGQTFGVEIELTGERWQNAAVFRKHGKALIKTLNQAVGKSRVLQNLARYGTGNTKLWNVEPDRSCGWEIVSPILQGIEGIQEMVKILMALDDVLKTSPLRINWQTGFHLHLGWVCDDIDALKCLILNMHEAEPYLANIVSQSRYRQYAGYNRYENKPNLYCQPIRKMVTKKLLKEASFPDEILSGFKDRYATLNLLPLRDKNTIEFRFHNGTTDALKAVRWLSLCQQLLHISINQNDWKDRVHHYSKRRIIQPDRSDRFFEWTRNLPGGNKLSFLSSMVKRSKKLENLYSVVQ